MFDRYWKWDVNGHLRGVFRLTEGQFQQCRNLQWQQSDYLERAAQDPEFVEVDGEEAARLCGELVLQSQLGPNPESWPATFLIERPVQIVQSFQQIFDAVQLVMTKPINARELIMSIDEKFLNRWYVTVALTCGRWRERHLLEHRLAQQQQRNKVVNTPRRVSEVEIDQIIRRDKWTCRYCHSPVAGRRKDFARFAKQIDFPELVSGRTDPLRNGIYLVFSASFDHVVPRSSGGSDDAENLVTACWPCQFGKGEYSLDTLGLSDPRLRPPIPVDGWQGIWPY